MKTKPIHKKEKKQLQEGSFPSKLGKKSKAIVKSKKHPQKIKAEDTAQNGDAIQKTKVNIQKINKQKKKQIVVKQKGDENIGKLPMSKISIAKEIESTGTESKKKVLGKKTIKKLEHLKNEQTVSETDKNKKGPRVTKILDIDIMRNKLAEIRSREVITKTAKKKIAALLRKITAVEQSNESNTLEATNEDDKNKQQASPKNKRKAQKVDGKNKKVKLTKQDNESDNDDENSMEIEEAESMENIEENTDTESIEDEEDDTDQKADESSLTKVKKAKNEPKKKRFVLFVGNLPYDITKDELKKHFLTKVNAVTDIRMQTKPGTNQSRGFAHVELSNSTDYEKGLSLNHTFLKKRRINVQYTASKNTSKADIVAKHKKLEALNKQGKLADIKKKKKLTKKRNIVESTA